MLRETAKLICATLFLAFEPNQAHRKHKPIGGKYKNLTFRELGIDEDIVTALETKGITSPFPIQEQAIPIALSGKDLIGQAKTGTGKTLGFGLPVIQKLGLNPEKKHLALIVVPTRELAQQVAADLVLATSNRGVQVAEILGGKSYEQQIAELQDGRQIIVGTPGRLNDLFQKGHLKYSEIEYLVLDEADEMLDLGFLPDIEKIFAATPKQKQTLLFSATMPDLILTLARKHQNKPVHIRATGEDQQQTKADIQQFVFRAHKLDKDELVAKILQTKDIEKVIVFTPTKRQASKLGEVLTERGFSATTLHGDMGQPARERSMKAFRENKKRIMVATEVAARGIDVDDVSHVINYSTPEDEKAYLHRTGRTGRAGKKGIAITLVDWDDINRWKMINKALELDFDEPVETYSSSPHLFEVLDIPKDAKGSLSRKTEPRGQESKPGASPGGTKSRRRNRSYSHSKPAGK